MLRKRSSRRIDFADRERDIESSLRMFNFLQDKLAIASRALSALMYFPCCPMSCSMDKHVSSALKSHSFMIIMLSCNSPLNFRLFCSILSRKLDDCKTPGSSHDAKRWSIRVLNPCYVPDDRMSSVKAERKEI